MKKRKVINRSIRVAQPGGVLLRDLKIRCEWGTRYDPETGKSESIYSVEVRSAMYPSALPPADADVLIELLKDAGIEAVVEDRLVEEVWQRDYPGLAWEYAL